MKGLRYLSLALLLISAVLLNSCCKKRVACDKETLKIIFTGFDRSIIRNISLKRYSKGDASRAKALDSGIYVNNTPVTVTNKPDTLAFSTYSLYSGAAFSVQYGFDYILTITSFNRNFAVTDINEKDDRYQKVPCKDNNTKCSNGIKSYAIDGFWVESNTWYIRK
jgi:hypothetical protein